MKQIFNYLLLKRFRFLLGTKIKFVYFKYLFVEYGYILMINKILNHDD